MSKINLTHESTTVYTDLILTVVSHKTITVTRVNRKSVSFCQALKGQSNQELQIAFFDIGFDIKRIS